MVYLAGSSRTAGGNSTRLWAARRRTVRPNHVSPICPRDHAPCTPPITSDDVINDREVDVFGSWVNSCYAHELLELEWFQTEKVTFKVIQGHWQWHHSIGHIRFPIKLPLQPYLYPSPFPRYYQLFPKLIEVTWPWTHEHIPFGGNLSLMY